MRVSVVGEKDKSTQGGVPLSDRAKKRGARNGLGASRRLREDVYRAVYQQQFHRLAPRSQSSSNGCSFEICGFSRGARGSRLSGVGWHV